MKLSKDDASAVIEPVLRSLGRLSYSDAAELPQVETRVVSAGAGEAELTIYREACAGGALRVIVQLTVDHGRFLLLFRHGQTFAEGVEFSLAQEPRRLREDELYSYS